MNRNEVKLLKARMDAFDVNLSRMEKVVQTLNEITSRLWRPTKETEGLPVGVSEQIAFPGDIVRVRTHGSAQKEHESLMKLTKICSWAREGSSTHDFVNGAREFYVHNGYLTEKQQSAIDETYKNMAPFNEGCV